MCIFFHLYHILKKYVQKHNTVYINKPTRNVIHLHSEVKKKTAFLNSLKLFCG